MLLHYQSLSPTHLAEHLHTCNKTNLPVVYSQDEWKTFIHSQTHIIDYKLDNEKLIGYILVQLNNNSAHICSLCVDTNYRNKNFGSQLITKMANFLHKINKNFITLNVQTTNTVAIKFYKKNNFHIVETLQHYYGYFSNAYHMKRILT